METKTIDAVLSSFPDDKIINDDAFKIIKDACKRIGISIDDYLKAVKEALKAEKRTVSKFGDVTVEPDHEKRLKAALIGLEIEGYIKAKGTVTDNSKNTFVTYQVTLMNILKQAEDKRFAND